MPTLGFQMLVDGGCEFAQKGHAPKYVVKDHFHLVKMNTCWVYPIKNDVAGYVSHSILIYPITSLHFPYYIPIIPLLHPHDLQYCILSYIISPKTEIN
jgi:hypothetical protein